MCSLSLILILSNTKAMALLIWERLSTVAVTGWPLMETAPTRSRCTSSILWLCSTLRLLMGLSYNPTYACLSLLLLASINSLLSEDIFGRARV